MDKKDWNGSLDRVFSELIHEANLWASDQSATPAARTMPQVNGRMEDKDDTQIDVCLEQLARAISAHVTDILIERLGLEERNAQTQEASTSMDLTSVSTVAEPPRSFRPRNITLKSGTTRSMPNTVRSLPQSPTCCRRAHPSRRVTDFIPRYADSTEQKGARRRGETMTRYHSENRLNRIEPAPNMNETPLENRASRLRRASIGKKLAGFRDRSLQ
ncbi:hypothetical protein RB195_002658 [Necator americanus]|uniref:Uncharacterized protein n=1 Tax=Necator americanus TaxID=51031 RepID=A0ABR1DKB5_NECAM